MAVGNLHDRLHVAADSGIVDRHNSLGFVSDGFLDPCFIKVEGIWMNIDKNGNPSPQHKGVRRGDKRV